MQKIEKIKNMCKEPADTLYVAEFQKRILEEIKNV